MWDQKFEMGLGRGVNVSHEDFVPVDFENSRYIPGLTVPGAMVPPDLTTIPQVLTMIPPGQL